MAISVESFFLDPSFEGTLQKQIQGIVASAILAGRFAPNEKLPSTRKLATYLKVSRITVTLAYSELVASEYLEARGRSGYFVSPDAPRTPKFDLPAQASEDTVDWRRIVGTRLSSIPKLRKPKGWRSFEFPFIYGQADPNLFDHHNWRQCALQALGRKDFATVAADRFERDDDMLLEYIARHSLPRRGIAARPEEILVTLGAQNALWLAAQLLLTQRRKAVLENPCYPGLREVVALSRCNSIEIDVDELGLPPEKIPADADVVFTTPSHHCPTSATMPMERRRLLLQNAARDDFIVVEDDYEPEISFAHAPSPALKSLDRNGRVVYVGSFSKSILPSLRLGYIVASEPFIREARALRAILLRHPPNLMQRITAYFLSLGHYDAMIRRTGAAYLRRREAMSEAIKAHGLMVAPTNSAGGSSFWMEAPVSVNSEELAVALRKEGVLIEPGGIFFHEPNSKQNNYRLAYSSISVDRIPEGIARIAKAIDRMT